MRPAHFSAHPRSVSWCWDALSCCSFLFHCSTSPLLTPLPCPISFLLSFFLKKNLNLKTHLLWHFSSVPSWVSPGWWQCPEMLEGTAGPRVLAGAGLCRAPVLTEPAPAEPHLWPGTAPEQSLQGLSFYLNQDLQSLSFYLRSYRAWA